MELVKRILKYRIKNNLDQKEMAEKLGISNKTLNLVEQEKKVSKKTLIKVEIKLEELERND